MKKIKEKLEGNICGFLYMKSFYKFSLEFLKLLVFIYSIKEYIKHFFIYFIFYFR